MQINALLQLCVGWWWQCTYVCVRRGRPRFLLTGISCMFLHLSTCLEAAKSHKAPGLPWLSYTTPHKQPHWQVVDYNERSLIKLHCMVKSTLLSAMCSMSDPLVLHVVQIWPLSEHDGVVGTCGKSERRKANMPWLAEACSIQLTWFCKMISLKYYCTLSVICICNRYQ